MNVLIFFGKNFNPNLCNCERCEQREGFAGDDGREGSCLMQPIRSESCEASSSIIECPLCNGTGVRVVDSAVFVVAHVCVGCAGLN